MSAFPAEIFWNVGYIFAVVIKSRFVVCLIECCTKRGGQKRRKPQNIP